MNPLGQHRSFGRANVRIVGGVLYFFHQRADDAVAKFDGGVHRADRNQTGTQPNEIVRGNEAQQVFDWRVEVVADLTLEANQFAQGA
ncbi:MAG TPA: hypothetical protein VGF98_00630 [Candidatus Tumulicola sp.]